jgi:hypothetical protein
MLFPHSLILLSADEYTSEGKTSGRLREQKLNGASYVLSRCPDPIVNQRSTLPRERKIVKKIRIVKKLEIAKETLRRLENNELVQAAAGSGGGWSDTSVCPTVTPRCP